MKNILYLSNYKEGVGGISGQVEFLHRNVNENFQNAIFNTRGNIFKRVLYFIILLIKGRKYNIFHIHGCSNWGGFYPIILGTIVGKLLNKKIIVTYHGGGADKFFSENKLIVSYFLNKANHLIVLSEFLAKVFQKYSLKALIIPNILEFNSSNYIEKKEIQPKFITTRSLELIYNLSSIIDAFQIIQSQIPEAELTIVGDGSQRNILENYVREQKINNVKFVGRVKNREIYDYLRNSDIWLNASLVDNMPVSLLEAQSCGLLVVSSNVGGIIYMIENGVNGLLIEKNDSESMAGKVLFALKNQDKAKQMILAGKKRLENYSWENNKSKLYSLYH